MPRIDHNNDRIDRRLAQTNVLDRMHTPKEKMIDLQLVHILPSLLACSGHRYRDGREW